MMPSLTHTLAGTFAPGTWKGAGNAVAVLYTAWTSVYALHTSGPSGLVVLTYLFTIALRIGRTLFRAYFYQGNDACLRAEGARRSSDRWP